MKRIVSVLLVGVLLLGLMGLSFGEPIERQVVDLVTTINLVKVLDNTGPYVEGDAMEVMGWPFNVHWQNTPWMESPTMTRDVVLMSGMAFPEEVYVGWYTITEQAMPGYTHDPMEYRFYIDENGVVWILTEEGRMALRDFTVRYENERMFRYESFWAIVEEDEEPMARNQVKSMMAMGKKGSWWDTVMYPQRQVPLFADKDDRIGTAGIGSTALYINLAHPMEMHLVELHAELAENMMDIPHNKGGNPKVGHFEYKYDFYHDGPWMNPFMLMDEEAEGWAAVHGVIAIPMARPFMAPLY